MDIDCKREVDVEEPTLIVVRGPGGLLGRGGRRGSRWVSVVRWPRTLITTPGSALVSSAPSICCVDVSHGSERIADAVKRG